MSGVWLWAVSARNWERSDAISAGERPAASRRSKPCGGSASAAAAAAAAGDGGASCGVEGGAGAEAEASAARAVEERV